MIVPSQRLLLLAAIVALPATTIAGLYPALAPASYLVLAILAILAAIDAFLGTGRIHQIELRTPPFLRYTKNVPAVLPVTIENRSPHDLPMRLGAVMPPGVESEKIVEDATSAPGLSLLNWPCTGRVRGDQVLRELHLETPSPLGLWQVREPRAVQFTFRVYPNLRDRATAALFHKTADAGLRLRRQIGKGREFDNLRQYMPGDSFEDIHWKATARRGFPVVKLYRVEHAQEVYAVLDSSRLSAREGILESYVDAALHLALVAERQGDHFGLVTFSDRTHRFVRARGGMEHFRLCRETIYNLRAERVSPDFREVFTSLQLNLRRRSLVVFFTSLDDALLAETFEKEVPLLARRHLVMVNVTASPGTKPLFTGEKPANVEALYEGLAGQMLWNRLHTLRIALQNRGVKLTVVSPDRIKDQVTAQYLDVKRRQAL
ncbi:MAG TPA: DUF58 domain-containing protein [Bryobacteraceae bacterium]|nr:DUF58 domain-containing protein [Bryobacteraceae bacterium]